MIDEGNKYFKSIIRSINDGGGSEAYYNGEAGSSIVSHHIGLLQLILNKLNLGAASFFTSTEDNQMIYHYHIKVSDTSFLRFHIHKDSTESLNITCVSIKGNDNPVELGNLNMDLTKSLMDEKIISQFKILTHFTETEIFADNPIERFTFNRGSRGRFGKNRVA